MDFTEIANGLAGVVDPECIETEPDVLNGFSVDNLMPKGVIFPKNTQQVSEVVKFANSKNLAIVPRGSGSKMAMGNPPKRLDLVVCTSSMNHMLDVDTANLTITVEAGVKFRDIQARLATEEDRCYLPLEDLAIDGGELICSDRSHSGCFLPIDPSFANRATIGGIVATNSSGPRRLLYNLPRDMILGVRLVTPRGEIAGAGGKVVKNVSGYDTSKLMVGSMGSLGILCEMTFKLIPLPEQMETLIFSFDMLSDACNLASRILETGLLPAAVDVMNGTAASYVGVDKGFYVNPGGYVVAVALEAFEKAVNRMSGEIIDMANASKTKSEMHFKDHEHLHFWLAVSNLASSLSEKFSGLIEGKLNYHISGWKDVFEFVDHTLSQRGIEHTIMAHAGSGICTTHLLVDQGDDRTIDRAVEAMEKLLMHSRRAGGNMIIQDAPADVKKHLKIWGELGPDFMLMRQLKKQVDPSGILSPGRFVGGL